MDDVLDLTLSDNDDDDGQEVAVKNEQQHSTTTTTQQQQQQQQSHVPRFNNCIDAPKITIVNGKGFWKSWTRSFKTTLLKLLDLIDNAVDGATHSHSGVEDFAGRVHIYPDIYKQSTINRKGEHLMKTTGLYIRNNSPNPIVPLSEALVVHHTTKLDEGEIGENGIGLKQACAALCDLSFILVKNGTNVELGIVAKSLQREEGPYLPAFQFDIISLGEQMASLFSQPKHQDVAQLISQYGADTTGEDPSLAAGIDKLCKKFHDICNSFYGNEYVFEVVLHKIRHDQDEGLGKGALDAQQQKITVNQLLKELKMKIPKTYLHIPDSLNFIVGGQKLAFRFWHERLVEFTTVTLSVGKTVPWKENFETSDTHPDSYDLRIFLGFDRQRITESDVEAETGEKRGKKEASLYFYSRKSGRLIKSEADARYLLGLTATGSTYCQALTVLIDDFEGHLPLTPTKQDISFALENKGSTHQQNLFAWVGAVSKYYYHFHLQKYGQSGAKKVLTAKISQHVDSIIPSALKSYSQSNFTTFKLCLEQYRNDIRVSENSAEIIGGDTYFRLLPDNNVRSSSDGQKKKKTPQRKKPKEEPNEEGGPPSKRTRKDPVSYREESDDSDEDMPNVKMEATATVNGDDKGCIDLCDDSSDEESTVEGREINEGKPKAEPEEQGASSASAIKIKELEQRIEQLKDESDSKIARLENELEQKEKIIAILKRRLGA